MAPVAMSIIANGQKINTSTINAATLISLAGCSGAGLVLWHEETLPPNTVAHDDSMIIAIIKTANIIINFFIFKVFSDY
ncbi:MAG: hypothetical protein WC836_22930 [Desulfobacula sp.]